MMGLLRTAIVLAAVMLPPARVFTPVAMALIVPAESGVCALVL